MKNKESENDPQKLSKFYCTENKVTKMNLKQFAEKAGVTLIRCDKEWGGTWGYTTKDNPNSTTCGYKTEQAAIKGWMSDTFGQHTTKAILSLLNKQA